MHKIGRDVIIKKGNVAFLRSTIMKTVWNCENGHLVAKYENRVYVTWSIDQVQGMFFADLLNANQRLSDLLWSVWPKT